MYPQITQKKAEVLVIGGSPLPTATQIAATFKTPFPVVADPNREAYRAFGFSKTALVIQQSGTVVVDMERRVHYLNRTTNPQTSLKRADLTGALETLS